MIGIRPLGDRVVIKKVEAEEKTQGGLILTSSAKEQPSVAEVVAVGPGTKDEPMELKVGEKVVFSKYGGTEIKYDMDCPVPLVADMSSDIMSRPVDVSKYALIYGGAQKNVGPAGVTFVIVRKDILGKVERKLQTMVDYRTHIGEEKKNKSMFNTPPVFPIFVMHETLKWLKEDMGGVEGIHKINTEKAQMLYDEIDRNSMFVGTAEKEDRSIMNVCFVMAKGHEDKQDAFMAFAKERGMVGIKGHRSVGGFRASIYNACPVESVKALIACMQEFEKLNA